MANGHFWKEVAKVFNKLFKGGDDMIDIAEKEWEHLEPSLKQGLINGSGIINEIASGKDSLVVIDAIKTLYPSLDLAKAQEAVQHIAEEMTGVAAAMDETFAATISNLQAYFKEHSGTKLEGILSRAAQFVASVLAPDSPYAKIVSFIEVAYRVFVKK